MAPEGASPTGRICFCPCAAKTAASGDTAEAAASCGILGESTAATAAAETTTASSFLCETAATAGGAACEAAALRPVKAGKAAGCGFFLRFCQSIRRFDIARGAVCAGLHRCFPAGPIRTECAAGACPLTAGCAFLRCCLTLAVRLRLVLLGRALAHKR